MMVIGFALVVVSNVLFYGLLDDVNDASRPEDRIPWMFAGARLFEIHGRHRKLFPASRMRKLSIASLASGFLLVLIAFFSAMS
jgi:hypothetical protein